MRPSFPLPSPPASANYGWSFTPQPKPGPGARPEAKVLRGFPKGPRRMRLSQVAGPYVRLRGSLVSGVARARGGTLSQRRWSAMVNDTRELTVRDQAVTQLKKRRDFHAHLLVYVLVNAFLVVIWAVI